MISKWENVPLEEIASLRNGYAFKSNDFSDTGVPVIKIKNVKPNKIILDNLSCLPLNIAESKSDYYINNGDILLTMTGNRADGSPESWVGKAALFNETGKYLLNQRIAAITTSVDYVDNTYLAYFLSSWETQLYFIKRANSSGGQANISPDIIKTLQVSLPPYNIQKEIAETLQSLDNKIELNRKINANMEAQAQTYFNELIIDANDGTWPEGCFRDIAEINPKRFLRKGELSKYVEMSNLPTSGSFPLNWAQREYSSGMKFKNGDTIMARITPCLENGKAAYINFMNDSEVAWGSTEFIVISAKENYCSEMFYFFARHPAFIDYAIANMNGSSGRQRVSSESIAKYSICIPPRANVERFGTIASPIMRTIADNALQNRVLAAIRDALLPKLMSGEIEVPVEVK